MEKARYPEDYRRETEEFNTIRARCNSSLTRISQAKAGLPSIITSQVPQLPIPLQIPKSERTNLEVIKAMRE